jgi:hypothetical protein
MVDKVVMTLHFPLPINIPPVLCHLSPVVGTDTSEATISKDSVSFHSLASNTTEVYWTIDCWILGYLKMMYQMQNIFTPGMER